MNKRIALTAAAGVGLFFTLACGGSSTIDTSLFVTGARTGGTATCPSDGSTADSFADGDRVVLLSINTDDAYAGSEYESRLPMSGRVDGDLHNNGGCWFGGGFVGDDGTDFYFYKAAFKAE